MLSKKNYLSYLENLKIKLIHISRYFALNLNFICNELLVLITKIFKVRKKINGYTQFFVFNILFRGEKNKILFGT